MARTCTIKAKRLECQIKLAILHVKTFLTFALIKLEMKFKLKRKSDVYENSHC